MKDCPRCGNRVPDYALFCGSCGSTIPSSPAPAEKVKPTPAKAIPVDHTLCPKCGLPRKQSGQFCTGCGTPLDPDVIARIQPPPPSSGKGGLLKFICIAVAIIIVLSIFGQRLSNSLNEKPTITITVHLNPNDTAGGRRWLNEMETEFANLHPEYNIIWYNEQTSFSYTYNQITFSSMNTADIYLFDSRELDALVDDNALSPITSYRDRIYDEYSDAVLSAVTHPKGEIYGFPFSQDTYCLYYNTEVFNESDILSLENMLAEGRVSLPLLDPVAAGGFFLGTGCTIFGENGDDTSAGFEFGGENGYAAAKKMLGLVKNSNIVISTLGADAMIEGNADAVFARSSDYQQLREAFGDRLGVAKLPGFSINGEDYQFTALSSMVCIGVNPASDDGTAKHQLCMDFAAFLSSDEAQFRRYEADGTIPSNPAVLDKYDLDAIVSAEIYTAQNASVMYKSCPEMDNYFACMESFIQQMLDGVITVTNYKSAVDDLNRFLN